MKNFLLAGSFVFVVAASFVWASQPGRHVPTNNHQYISEIYRGDTVPKRRDTLPRRDTMRRKDSLQ